ncbi:ComF family protein [Pedobacter sp. L105]|uniref:ComF family protein n=1 Tax=Pedobacter sp. L105 TaxID=1641871 RepID=UPI00131B9E46|nr:ComF family protein [Pedobacter sp. L105]
MLLFKQYFGDFISLLFPDLCNACGTQLFHGEEQICTKCLHDLPYTDFHLYADNAVAKLFWGRIACHAAMAMLYFRKGSRVQNLIHRLKYNDQIKLGFVLGSLLGEKLAQSDLYLQADLIIPVPLHPRKERSRGYNQALQIALGVADKLRLPVPASLLVRNKATSTQTKKNRYSRFENMKAVFSVTDPASLSNKHVLLVDDVITTGATLEACAQVLLDAGVAKLSIVALAFAE